MSLNPDLDSYCHAQNLTQMHMMTQIFHLLRYY